MVEMTNLYGLSEKQRLKGYAKDPDKHKYKSAINCLKDENCRECSQEHNCKIITIRKKMGRKNPWEY